MEKEHSSDSNSSFELPDLSAQRTFDVEKLEKGNLVWALYQNLYWPALVRNVNKKNKKVRIWYLDTPGKCFKVPFNKIENFEDPELNKKVLQEAKLDKLAQRHYEVFRRSLLFLFRRSRGIEDNPKEFFDTSKPYFFRRAFDDGNSENKITSGITSIERVCEKSPVSSEGESLVESDEESHCITKSIPELYVENSPYSDERINKILSCIKAGHVDNHLMDILNSKVVSERHDLFMEAVKTCNIEMLSSSPSYIPVVDNDKLQNISLYLSNLYEQKIGKDQHRMSEYIVSVWLPEAVEKAISLIETDSFEQPIYTGNASNLSVEADVKENINESSNSKVSCSEVVSSSSKSTIDCDNNKVNNQETKEINVKTKEKFEKQLIDCESKASTVLPNSSMDNNIDIATFFTSESEDSDSTMEEISVGSSPRKYLSYKKNKVTSKKRKGELKASSKKPAFKKITKLQEEI